ncbi:MAG: DoxX subfamily, partial [Vicinamibacteria bacterium]|nr:DoxX subfamily [Vicinamibacteria bacterium]
MSQRTRLEAVALVLLRTVIGWHFLYEGYYKLI